MPFICGDHTHETVDEARAAHAVPRPTEAVSGPVTAPTPEPIPQPAPAPAAPYAAPGALWEPMTGPQRDYALRLGLDLRACELLGKRGVSQYIDVHKGIRPLHLAVEVLHGKAATRYAAPPAPVVSAPPAMISTEPTPIPPAMIDLIKSGYYGARVDEKSPYVFFKVVRPKNGQYKGCTKISTRHGDDWKLAWVLWPSGRATSYRHDIVDLILETIPNIEKAGHKYAQEIGSCCICGKTLTDERSRYYGIGPDCETRHLYKIAWVEDQYGPWVPGRGFSVEDDR